VDACKLGYNDYYNDLWCAEQVSGIQIKICLKTNPVIELGQQIKSYNPKSIEN